MRVQSIRTAVEPRYPACDRFLCFAVEMTLGKMDGIAELDYLAKKVGTMAETFQDTGHLLATRLGAPFVVDLGDFAGCIVVFDEFDLGFVVRHRRTYFLAIQPEIYHGSEAGRIHPTNGRG
jgi:hypothetical protein